MGDDKNIYSEVKSIDTNSESPLHTEKEEFIRPLLHTLINNTPNQSWAIDTGYKVIALNNPFKKVIRDNFGMEISIGDNLDTMIPPEIAAEWREHYARAFEGETFSFEKITRFKTGTFYTHNYVTPIVSSGKVLGVVVTTVNSTELKEMEKAYRERRKEYERMFNNIDDVIFRADMEGVLTMINPAGVRLLGYDSEDEVIGKNIAGTFYSNPADRNGLLEELKKEGRVKNYELLLKKKDDSEFYVETNAQLICNDNEKPYCLEGIFRDITERKKADERIKKSEESYRNLFHNAQVGLFRTRIKDGMMLEANDQIARMFGYENREKLIHNYITDGNYVDPNARSKMLSILLEKGEITGYEAEFYRKDGSTKWLRYSARVFKDKGYLEGVAEDISEHKAIQKELNKQNKLLNALHTTTLAIMNRLDIKDLLGAILKQAIDIIDTEHSYIYMYNEDNDTMRLLLATGMLTQYIGLELKRNEGLAGTVWAKEDAVFVNDYVDWGNKSTQFGDHGRFGSAGVPLTSSGKVIGVLGVSKTDKSKKFSEDTLVMLRGFAQLASMAIENAKLYSAMRQEIKERRSAEEKLRIVTDNVADIVWSSDKRGNVTFITPAIKDVLGYDVDEVTKLSYSEILTKESSDLLRYLMINAINRTESTSKTFELEYIRKDGSKIWCEVTATSLVDDDGSVIGFTGVTRDISVRKKTEIELIKAKEKAELSDKFKSEFLAQMSHEIRTPINTVLSFTSLIKAEMADKIDADLQTSFKSISRAGQRIIRTIDLLLNMSELQTGIYEYTPKEIDINDQILHRLYEEFKPLASEKNIEFNLISNLKSSLITVDEYSVSQMIGNLVDNALKYTPEGEIKIVLDKDDKDKIFVEVIDTGIGISKEYIPYLFESFSQEEQGYTRKFEGNGLGLALVKRYSEMNKASIDVQSEKGKGSSFKVTFNNS